MDRRGGRVERVLGTLYRSSGSIRPRAHGQSLEISRRRKSRREEMVEDTERDGEKRRFGRFGRRRLPARRCRGPLSSLRCGEGAHVAVPEETNEKREKRRREYSTTDDIIGALCLSRVILPAEVLFYLSLSPCVSFSIFLHDLRFFLLQLPSSISDSRGI